MSSRTLEASRYNPGIISYTQRLKEKKPTVFAGTTSVPDVDIS